MKRIFNRALLTAGISLFSVGILASHGSSQKKPTAAQHNTIAMQSAPQPVAANISEKFIDQGQTRTYSLHTPPNYHPDQPLPLIIALHGSQETGEQMQSKTQLSPLSDRANFIVAYPDALNQKWNVSGSASENNVAFVHTLIGRIAQIRKIDPTRVYVVGLSNGGILAQKLACENPSDIAAIATVAASLPNRFRATCQTQTPVSLLMINGTSDEIVPWQGGAYPQIRIGKGLSIPPIPDVVEFWRQHDRCDATATTTTLSDRAKATSYTRCQNNSEVTLITLDGAGHIWAGAEGQPSAFINTTQTVWDFLQRHQKS